MCQGLITVSSSPCFTARDEWPGIKPEVLAGFQHQLSDDFHRTVERFLALQTLGTESSRQDARLLKSVVLQHQMPDVEVLTGGWRSCARRIYVQHWLVLRCLLCAFTVIWTVWSHVKWHRY